MRRRNVWFGVLLVGVLAASLLAGAAMSPAAPAGLLRHAPTPLGAAGLGSGCGRGGCRSAPSLGAVPTASARSVRPSTSGDDSWTSLTPLSKPPAIGGAAFAYDAADGYFVLFGGGMGTVSGASTYHVVNYTYAYHPISNSWANLSSPHAPPAFDQWSMAYDAADGYVVLFGGNSNATWTFHAGAWTELPASVAPSSRYGACMAWDSEDNYVLLFGGAASSSGVALQDTWSFASGVWTNRTTPDAPPAAYGCTVADDPAAHEVVEFGGWSNPELANLPIINSTWAYGGGVWTNLSLSYAPGPRYQADLSYVPGCGCLVMFGGFYLYWPVGEHTDGDTWVFGPDGWTPIGTPTGPGTRAEGSMAFDPALNEAVLFGGFSYSGLLGDTWAFAAPVAVAITTASTTVDAGAPVTFTASATTGVTPVTFSWSSLPSGCNTTVGARIGCTAPTVGSYNVTVVALDANQVPGTATLALTVVPTLTVSAAFFPNATDVDRAVWLNATSAHGTGGTSYAWQDIVPGLGCGPLNASLDVTSSRCAPPAAGYTYVYVEATDSSGFTVSSATVGLVVNANLSATFVQTPADPGPGANVTLSLVLSGGTAPFTVHYGPYNLPCPVTTLSGEVCQVPGSGAFTLRAEIVDAVGETANVTDNGTVALPAGSTAASIGGLALLGVAAIAGAAVVLGAVVVVLARRRRDRR